MSHIIERRTILLDDAEKIYGELFRIRIRELEDKYRREVYRKSVINTFEKAAKMWGRSYDRPAASLGICSLYSSVMMQTYQYRLVMAGEEFWLDKEKVEIEWVPEGIFDDFEEDIQLLLSKLKNNYPRICKNEEEVIRCLCMDYYHAAAYQLCKDLMEEIAAGDEFTTLIKTEDFYIYYGKYEGGGEIIYRSKG